MWHEGEAGRGANEISSCLFAHIMQIPAGVKHLTLASDSCSGQNRKSIISSMLHTALQVHPTIESVEHFFLETGHTRLDCDSKHSQIEKAKATAAEVISIPAHWYQLVQTINTVNEKFPDGTFEVVQMGGKFFDFAKLLKGPLVLRKVSQDGNSFNWLKAHIFEYHKIQPGLTYVKNSFSDLEENVCLNMRPLVNNIENI